MKRFIFLIAVLLCVFVLPSFAQLKKRNPAKVTPVLATVTAKVVPSEPSEETAGIWNDYVSEKYGFRITFPSPAGKVFDDDENDKFINFSAATRKADYSLTVKNMLVSLNNNQLGAIYESVLEQTEDPTTSKLISKKNVYLNGVLGKEVVYEENGRHIFGRFYILESKLFMLTVSLAKKDYTKNFDRWAVKFFDSFGVKSNKINA